MEKMNLKIKKYPILEIIQYIILLYAAFLFFMGIIINNTELVIEVVMMLVIWMIFGFWNKEELLIKTDELYTTKYGSIKYEEIENLKIINNVIEIKMKNINKKYKIYLGKNSKIELSKFNKYITSKI